MAIMIPSVMSPEIKSNAERKIFEFHNYLLKLNAFVLTICRPVHRI